MKNDVKRAALAALANAPKIAADAVIKTINDLNDKNDARRLFAAIGIKPATVEEVTTKNN
jgi:hypothetical protein